MIKFSLIKVKESFNRSWILHQKSASEYNQPVIFKEGKCDDTSELFSYWLCHYAISSMKWDPKTVYWKSPCVPTCQLHRVTPTRIPPQALEGASLSQTAWFGWMAFISSQNLQTRRRSQSRTVTQVRVRMKISQEVALLQRTSSSAHWTQLDSESRVSHPVMSLTRMRAMTGTAGASNCVHLCLWETVPAEKNSPHQQG